MTGCFYFLGFKEVDQEEEDEGVDGWYDCYGQCEICVDYDFGSQQCLEHGWVSANPDSDPKQVCFDSSGTFDDPDHVCQNKFFSNIIESYGSEVLVLDCVYTNYPDAGPIHTSWNCDEPADGEGTYTSGTEALRATLLEVDANGSHATITVGNNSETVGVKGWIEVTESPFRLVQLRLSPTDDIVLGSDTWTKVMVLNTGPPRGGTLTSGSFAVPVGGFVLDAVGANAGRHYTADITMSGAVTGTLGSTSFTASYSYSGPGGSVTLWLEGSVAGRPPVAAFSAGTPAGCSLSVDGTGSTDPDGSNTIAGWYWLVNGNPAGVGSSATLTLQPGTNVVELTVSDAAGLVAESRASKVVQAAACAP